jgi:hypothetical protein
LPEKIANLIEINSCSGGLLICTVAAQGNAMDRDEYFRRASALEERAADYAHPGLRAALLNIAAEYRNLAKQAVVPRADVKLEGPAGRD